MTDSLPAPMEPDDLSPYEDEEHKPFEPYDGLTPQRRAFVDKYVETGNGAESAKAAGFSARHAKVSAAVLLNTPIVAAAVSQKMNERAQRTMITADRVLEEVAILAFSNIDNYILDD